MDAAPSERVNALATDLILGLRSESVTSVGNDLSSEGHGDTEGRHPFISAGTLTGD
jgi:hypothetical protein